MQGHRPKYYVAVDFGTASSAIAVRRAGPEAERGTVMLDPNSGAAGIQEKLPSDISFYFSEEEYAVLQARLRAWKERTVRRKLAEAKMERTAKPLDVQLGAAENDLDDVELSASAQGSVADDAPVFWSTQTARAGDFFATDDPAPYYDGGGSESSTGSSVVSVGGAGTPDESEAEDSADRGPPRSFEGDFFRLDNSFLGVEVPPDVDRAACPKIIRFRGFKAFLYHKGRIAMPDFPRAQGSDSRSYALYNVLLVFFKHICQVVRKHFASRGVDDPDITYTLTVPTIATSASNLFYKTVFARAFEMEEGSEHGIQLINESEAAATFVLTTEFFGRRTARLSTNSLFAICDFGGGTADFSLMEMVSLRPLVLDLSRASMGRAAGGYYIDAAFLSAMENILRPHPACYGEFYTAVMAPWHVWKHTAKYNDEDYSLELEFDNILNFYVPAYAQDSEDFQRELINYLKDLQTDCVAKLKAEGFPARPVSASLGRVRPFVKRLTQALHYSAFLFQTKYFNLYPGRRAEATHITNDMFDIEYGEITSSNSYEDCCVPLKISFKPRYVIEAFYNPPIEQTMVCAAEFVKSAFRSAADLSKSVTFMMVGGFSTCGRIAAAFRQLVADQNTGDVSCTVIAAQNPSLAILRGAILLAESGDANADGQRTEVACRGETFSVREGATTFLSKLPAHLFLGFPITSDMLTRYVNTADGQQSTIASLQVKAEYMEYQDANMARASGNVSANVALRLVRSGTRALSGSPIAELAGVVPFSAAQKTLALYVYDSRHFLTPNSSIAAADKTSQMSLIVVPSFEKGSGQAVAECSASCFTLDLDECRRLSRKAFPVLTLRLYYDPTLRLEACFQAPDGSPVSLFCRYRLDRGPDAPGIRGTYAQVEDALFQFACPYRCPCGLLCVQPPALCAAAGEHYRCQNLREHRFPCGHVETLKCYTIGTARCPHLCGKMRACGHPCAEHVNHPGRCESYPCEVLKEYVCDYCGKSSWYKCSEFKKVCTHPCKYVFICGHDCTSTCQHVPDGNHPLLCSTVVERRCEHGVTRCDCSDHRFCKKPCTHGCDNPTCPQRRPQCNRKCCDDCVPCCRCRCTHTCPTCGKRCSSFTGHPCVFLCGCNGVVPEIFSLLMATVIDEEDLEEDDVLIYLPCHTDMVFVYEDLRQFYSTTIENMDSGQGDVCLLTCPLCKSELYGVWCLSDLIAKVLGKIEARISRLASGALSKEERMSIFRAMEREAFGNTALGHFFQCQCGYQYFVGECGGPMQEVQCPECHRTIGGRDHNVASGVQLAEMDYGQGNVNKATIYTHGLR